MNLIQSFLTPGWNRYTLVGMSMVIVGILLMPFLIGLPIAAVGFSILAIGTMVSIVRLIPGGKKLVGHYEEMFRNMFAFLRAVISDGMK